MPRWTIRFLVLSAIGVFGPLFAGTFALAAETPPSVDSLKQWRKPAVERQRRIIFNNDGAEPVVHMARPSAQEFLDQRTSGLVGSQVDSIFYCPRCSGFSMFTYFTKVGQVFTTREGRYANNQMEALLREGIDPLQVIVDFGKQHKLEVFCSFRMNDNHDGTNADYAPLIFRTNKLKHEHPEYLLGTIDRRPKIGAWSAVDYGQPEIRDLAFRYAEEVCRNYDVDGIELDFFRHVVFFKSTSRGETATDEDRAAMTSLMARIRKMADEVGKARGRPILIAMRLPDSIEYSRAVGLDLERWLADDLLDLYIAAGTFQLNDWEYSVALARKYGVKIYPSLDDSRVKDPVAKEMRMTNFAYRGRAADIWAAGADGVYLYNFFDHLKSDSSLLREIGSAAKLAKLDKDFLPASRGIVKTSGGSLPYEKYLKYETLNPANPKTIAPGKTALANIHLGDTLDNGSHATLNLQIRFKSPPNLETVRAKFNGQPIRLTIADADWLQAPVPLDAVTPGPNQVEITCSPTAKEKLTWIDLKVQQRTEMPR